VPKDELFPLDMERAVNKLDELKPHVAVVYGGSSHGMQLLRDGEVDMAPIWISRAWLLVDEGVPLEVVWNDAFLSISNWIVAKDTPRREQAFRLIDFTNDAERMAKFAGLTSYGPLRKDAFEYLSEDQARRMPTYPENWEKGIVQEVEWTGANLDKILRRYEQWLLT
jgi:putative spermidine/putrescine transport system substrate-binding protein